MSFILFLQKRLLQALPGKDAQIKMSAQPWQSFKQPIPNNSRKGGVLIILYPYKDTFKLVLIVRSEKLRSHSGQIALPGGGLELEDVDLKATALREANEEVGIEISLINIIGELTPIYIPVSNYLVLPVIGYCDIQPDLKPSDDEVAGIIEIPIQDIFKNKTTIDVELKNGNTINAPAYLLYTELKLWGATAMMLSELEVLWHEFEKIKNRQTP